MNKLNVFVSWSGERSRSFAQSIVEWLPHVLQGAQPWISSDLEKGNRWFAEIGQRLAGCDVGLFCVTPENMHAPWLAFEAGATSHAVQRSTVCPLLLGLNPEELEGPLSEFQSTVFEREDMFRLVQTLNGLFEAGRVSEPVLARAFEQNWERVESGVAKAARINLNENSLRDVVKVLARQGLEQEPAIGSSAFFRGGFESHILYETALGLAHRRVRSR